MTKAELRKLYLARRRAVSPEDAARWSAAIQARVLALSEMQGREDVYIYIASDNEPDTREIMEALLRQERRVFASIIDRTLKQMHWGLVSEFDKLRPGAYGILEPPRIDQRATEAHRGVAILPCVAFTAICDRLGRGGGYYDNFLAAFSGRSIALAYELQRAEALVIEPHDIRPHSILTESQLYLRKPSTVP